VTMNERLARSLFLSRLFGWAFQRHIDKRHFADYEACPHLFCRSMWTVENWLWYGGRGE